MKPGRIAAVLFLVALIAVAAAALYVYRNLDSVVTRQLTQQLAAVGVTAADVDALTITPGRLNAARLTLTGSNDATSFALVLDNLTLSYKLSELLGGKLRAVSIGVLSGTIEGKSRATQPAGVSELSLSAWLPGTHRGALPVANMAVGEVDLLVLWEDIAPIQVSGGVQSSAATVLSLQAKHPLLHVEMAATASETEPLTTKLHLTTPPQKAGSPHRSLAVVEAALIEADGQSWQWTAAGSVEWTNLLAVMRHPEVSAELASFLGMTSTGPTGTPSTHLVDALSGVSMDASTEWQLQASHADVLVLGGTAPPLAGTQIDLDLSAQHTVRDAALQKRFAELVGEFTTHLELSDDSRTAVLQNLDLRTVLVASGVGLESTLPETLQWTDRIPMAMALGEAVLTQQNSGTAALTAEQLTLVAGPRGSPLRLEDLALTVQTDDLALLLAEQRAGATLIGSASADIAGYYAGAQLPGLRLKLQQSGRLEKSTVQLALSDRGNSTALSGTASVNLLTGDGRLALTMGVPALDTALITWNAFLDGMGWLPEGLVLEGGEFDFGSKMPIVAFTPVTAASNNLLRITAVSGTLDSYGVSNLAVSAGWEGVNRLRTLAPATLSAAAVNAGIALSNLDLAATIPEKAALADAQIHIERLSAEMLGGRAFLVEPAVYQAGATRNAARLAVENWRLAEVVSLQQREDIYADGILEGELSVAWDAGRLLIDGGYLRTLPPGGSIRYQPDVPLSASAAGGEQLAMALDLLTNFQYDLLRSEVVLDRAGNLSLGLSLAGSNPERFDGREVRFNINLEQNIDPLLQSLQMGDKLMDSIERRRQ